MIIERKRTSDLVQWCSLGFVGCELLNFEARFVLLPGASQVHLVRIQIYSFLNDHGAQ